MEITKKTEYAISALVELALHPGEFISSKTIASRQEIPTNFLPQILALLGSQGWLHGMRGPGGGVRLERDPATLSVMDVIELIEGPIAISKCLSHELTCSRKGRCPLQPVWSEAQDAFVSILSNRTIADLVKNTPQKT